MTYHDLLLVAAIFLLVMGLTALILSRRTQKATGLPMGKLVYSDTTAWRKVNRAYYDARWGLAGKPDYVIDVHGVQIPVEVKSSSASHPYDSHVMQVAAYCRLIEAESGRRPPFGVIKYASNSFEIQYTEMLEQRLERLIMDIRCEHLSDPLLRSHNSPARCAGCGYRSECDQRLDTLHSSPPKKI